LKSFKNFTIIIYFLLLVINIYGQQKTRMNVLLNNDLHTLTVKQTIQFTNSSNKSLSKLVLNDWNNAYSDKNSPLGKRFSDEYVRSFQMASDIDRGHTNIQNVSINKSSASWNRAESQPDIIEVLLESKLKPNDSVSIEFSYSLKIPDDRFTGFGHHRDNYYLKNCFLSISRLSNEGEFSYYSNENLEDIANATYKNISLDIIVPKDYEITSDLDIISKIDNELDTKTFSFYGKNRSEIELLIENKSKFESFKNDKIEVQTNLSSKKVGDIQKAIVVDRIVNFVSNNLGEINTKKIIVSQIDYERNPFYGLNQLPSFISPFPNEFIYELKFLKTYLYSYLKTVLKIDARKDNFIFDAIQQHVMKQYIEENYPKMKLLGSISKLKILKSYRVTNVSFNEQYSILHLLMARDNLDQTIGDPKNTFIKFNEQIAGKYKAGLSFSYLDYYLKDSTVNKSFKEFIVLNNVKETNRIDLETILKKNATKNIDWFFPNLIDSRKIIDYKFDKIVKTKDSITIIIKNNAKATVPISFYGIKKREIIFKQWLTNIKTDTTFTIKKSIANKLVLNYESEVPEFNMRNNYKSLKGFLCMNRPIKFNFFRDVEDPRYNQIFYLPEVSYNLYDGFLWSIGLNNDSFLKKPFNFDIQPSYSSKTKTLSGSGSIAISQYLRDTKLYNIRYGLSGSYFHYAEDANYLRIIPTIQFRIRENDFRNNKRQYISLREVIVDKEKSLVNIINNSIIADSPLKYSVFDLRYLNQKSEIAKNLSFSSNLQFSNIFGKIAGEIGYRKLFENNFEYSLRLYAGSFIYRNTDSEFFSFGLDRPKDYLFDYNYYGRSETSGLFSQQFITAEGGFKSKFSNPYANQWLTALNGNASIWRWIQMYGDVGLFKSSSQNTRFVYDSGIHLNLVPGYFELFFPVLSSNGFEMGQQNYQQKIRFIVTLSPRTLISLFTRKWF
jgi:hypothetical protein